MVEMNASTKAKITMSSKKRTMMKTIAKERNISISRINKFVMKMKMQSTNFAKRMTAFPTMTFLRLS